MKILCVFGRYDYGDPLRGEGYEFRNFIPGFEMLGHEVIHFDSWDRRAYRSFSELNQALLDCVETHCPDVLFCVPLLYEIWLETLAVIKKRTSVKTILWCTDDSWKYREVSRHIGHEFDRVVTTYPHILPCYHRDGIFHVILSQWAADAATLHAPLPAAQCRYPVVFVGAAHGDRKNKIRQLEKMGIPVQVFGYGWKSGPVPGNQIPQIIRSAQVALNFSNSKGADQLKARTFEVPGAGGFLMTEAVDGISAFYAPGREIVVADSIQEMGEKILYYMKHPQERDRIAENGFERTQKEHLYFHRFEKILDGVSAWTASPPAPCDDSLLPLDSPVSSCHKPAPSCDGPFIPSDSPLRQCLVDAVSAHQTGRGLVMLKNMVVTPTALVVGKKRAKRLARRIFYEIGWRFFGRKIFTASGWPGRMFYHES
jgi:spore maturation protein CgeB